MLIAILMICVLNLTLVSALIGVFIVSNVSFDFLTKRKKKAVSLSEKEKEKRELEKRKLEQLNEMMNYTAGGESDWN